MALASCAGNETAQPSCPNVAVVAETAQVTKFRPGPGRDLTDVVVDARIADFDGSCTIDTGEGANGEVEVELRLLITASRGPANQDRRAQVRYFVAVGDNNSAILAKETFTSAFEFEGNRSTQSMIEELDQRIPLRAGESGEGYQILVGFQLSEEEIAYNRARALR